MATTTPTPPTPPVTPPNKILAWLSTNKVLLLGMLGAIGMTIEQYANEATPDYKVIGFAVVIAIISFLSKNLRGQWISILGTVGTSVGVIATAVESGNKVAWFQVIASTIAAIVAAAAPAGKSLQYESSPAIVQAKAQAATADQAAQKSVPVAK